MKKPTFKLEKALIKEGYELIIGVDEAGRGPLAGPVVACATTVRKSEILNPKSKTNSKLLDLIRDSKTLSHKQREKLFDFIHKHFYIGVGICGHQTIDRMNILQATFLAMKKATTSLMQEISNFQFPISNKIPNPKSQNTKYQIRNTKYIILVDGNRKIPNFSHKQKAIPNGDKIVKSISAASIIAKVTRDRIMLEIDKKYPQYNFSKHKGYGTKLHMKMLVKHGPCKIHRRSFAPVRKLVKNKKQ